MFATAMLKLPELPSDAKDGRVYDLNPLPGRTSGRPLRQQADAGGRLPRVLASAALVAYTGNFWVLRGLVTLAGAGFNGAQNTVNPYIAPYDPPSLRSTGVGMCYGSGRMGAILEPALIGIVMSMHFSYRATVIAIALAAIVPASGILTVPERYNFARQVATEKAMSTKA